jgi:hypothetical protein
VLARDVAPIGRYAGRFIDHATALLTPPAKWDRRSNVSGTAIDI